MYRGFSSIESDMRDRLVEMTSTHEIPARWRGTPIEHYIQAQNLGYPLHPSETPQILISTCIEFRYALPIPAKFAYVIRTAGGRLVGQEFAVAYALTRGVRNILLIAHDDCGMAKVRNNRPELTKALTDQGWSQEVAAKFVAHHCENDAIVDELESLETEYHRLKRIFRDVHVAPLFLTLQDKRVHLPKWYHTLINSAEPQAKPVLQPGCVSDEDLRACVSSYFRGTAR